jgi:predicted GTPase
VVFNKCDGLYDEGEVISESARLGLGEAWTVSAEEGSGVI